MMSRTLAFAAVAVLAACGGKPKVTESPVKETIKVEPSKPRSAEELFAAECRVGLTTAQARLPEILAVTDARTVVNTVEPYHDLLIGLGQSAALAGLMSEVHPDEKVRDAARVCEQEVSKFGSDLQLNKELYQALATVDVAGLDAEGQRFLEHTLRDFRRAGVDQDDATRGRLKQIEEDLTRLGQQFSKNLAEDVRAIEIDSAERLAGLPADFIAAHAPGDGGKIRVTTDYPDYNPFMTYALDDELRKELYVKNRSRGDAENEQLLGEILTLRAEKAGLLKYASYADYITEDKMIKSGTAARVFIDKTWKAATNRAKRDYAELLKELKTVDKKATVVQYWQKEFLENRVRASKYQVDSQEVRKYFPYAKVLAGLLSITSEIYDIQYVPAADAKPWHPEVQAFDVVRAGTRLGRIYLDMHPRDGKYKHAAQFTLKDGVAGKQLPEGVLVCNFPTPKGDDPALMEHDDVVTMFHEFGHLMHHVLGGGHRWVKQSGVATEWDFVEAPSQMFEEWAWSHDTLARFAVHHETGAVIPKDLVERMRKADKFGVGTQTVQQMLYAALSLEYHAVDPAKLDQLELLKKLHKKYTYLPYVEGTKFHLGFGHLVGYSAMYYTYMWSLVIAKDLLTPFQKTGLMDLATTRKYRDTILAPGGTKDAAVLVKDFLGRDYDFKAFEKYLGE